MTPDASTPNRTILIVVGALVVAAGVAWTAVRAMRRAAAPNVAIEPPRPAPSAGLPASTDAAGDPLEKGRLALVAAARAEFPAAQTRADEALKLLEKAGAWPLAGRAAELAGWDDRAEAAYRKAGCRSELGRLLFVRAALSGDETGFAEAARELEAGDASAAAEVMIARARGKKDEALRKAREAVEKLQGKPGAEEFHWLEGLCLPPPEDGRAFDRALALRPSYGEALVSRAAARMPRGEPHEALEDLTEALRRRPRFGEARYHRGAVRFAMRDFTPALEDLDEALRIRAGHSQARLKRAAVRVVTGDLEGAVKDYDEVLRLLPAAEEAWLNRGLARARKGDFPGSVADFTRLIELEPNSAPAHFQRGTVRTRMGAYEGAVQDLSRAIEIKPGWGEAYVARGVAREKAGDVRGGVADVRNALKLELGPDEQREAHDLLERNGEKP